MILPKTRVSAIRNTIQQNTRNHPAFPHNHFPTIPAPILKTHHLSTLHPAPSSNSTRQIQHLTTPLAVNPTTTTTTTTTTIFPHRDNVNARYIKAALRTLHLARYPSTGLQMAMRGRGAGISLGDIVADLKAIVGDLAGGDVGVVVGGEGVGWVVDVDWKVVRGGGGGLKDCFLDLGDLKRDVVALRGDVGDVEVLIGYLCEEGTVDE
ncbi:uncharacterized protein RCO7_02310 [Rhynchosporium graminicola]|uniref:Uncharacterized protein n=1 Tax=Rhynchosporium graminicola TaxID=2792576 RepID=A0A1E1JWC1_9HELO|nr:uncharacterized protein RCO7_02310 [Rhynchosporium commune]